MQTQRCACLIALVAFLAIISIPVVGCKSESPEDQEARAEAQKLVDKIFTKCGDSLYGYGDMNHLSYLQLKGDLHLALASSQKLSQVDRLNGLEWNGEATLTCQYSRTFAFGGWSDWESKCSVLLPLYKKNGAWIYAPQGYGTPIWDHKLDTYSPAKPSCEKLPK